VKETSTLVNRIGPSKREMMGGTKSLDRNFLLGKQWITCSWHLVALVTMIPQ